MTTTAALCLALLLAGCTTLPGYQGGPGPRSTQYTYPGRAWNPDTGLAHSPIPTVAAPVDGGIFAFGLVYWDGSTGSSVGRWTSLEDCERERQNSAALFAERAKDGGMPIMTVTCHRAHETGVMQSR